MTFNTGNNVPSTDPRDLYDNAENLDKLVNGADPFYADRKGKLRQSWAGMENDFDTSQEGRENTFTLSQANKESRFQAFLVSSGYVSKGDYAANVVLAERNEYVAVDAATTGTTAGLYRPGPGATLPLTLTGTWATDKASLVLLGDDVLRQELAAAGGAAMVGIGGGRTVADRLNDTANVKDYGAIADGTLHPLSERFATLAAAQAVYPHVTALTQSIDWAAAQAALNSGSPRVHFPGQRYVFNDDLSRNSSVMLVGDGTTVLEFTAGKRMALAGSLSALPALSANVTTLSRSLTFTSAPGLSSGDVVLAYNPTDYSWSPHRAYYRQGEFFRVHAVSGSTANIFGLPAEDYAASAMQMYKVNGIRVAMQDLIIVGAASTVGAIVQIRFGVNVSLTNVDAYGGSSYPIELDRCYQVDILCGGGRNNSPYVDDEYGLIISNCQRVTITGGDHAATRHAIALGGGNDTGAVPCRDIFINNMSLICAAADIGAADMHGNVERVTYSNCHITHANMAGRNVTLRGCTIYQRTSPSDGAAVFGSEIVGGTFLIEDCVLITAGDLGAFGAITLSMTHTLKEKLNLVVRGLIVKGGAGGALAKLVKVSVANGETRKCNVDIRGVRCELAQAQSVLYIRCDGNPNQVVMSDGHIVDDIYGPSGMYLIFPSGSALDGIPTRQMEQAGEAVITTANTAAFALPAQINFRYPYSKRPTAGVVASGSDGAAFSTLGGAAPVPVIYTLTSTAIRPAVVAPSGTFTNGVSALIHWRSGIKEI